MLERIRVVRKQLRKNHQRRSMIEGGYEDEDHGGDEGEDSQEVSATITWDHGLILLEG